MITLRSFCCRSVAGIAVLALSPLGVARQIVRSPRGQTIPPDFEAFATHLGSRFEVDGREHGLRVLRLICAEQKKPSRHAKANAPDAANEKFSLVFADDRTQRLEQDCYAFTHPDLGRFDMVIVPVGSLDPAVHKYEAIFNRPRTA